MPSKSDIQLCKEKEFYAYGTAWLFEQRARAYRRKLKVLSWSTFAIPLVVAAILVTFDQPKIVAYTRTVSGVLGGALTLFGLWAIVGNWTDSLAGAERSMLENTKLHDAWRTLKAYTGADFGVQLATLKGRDTARQEADQLLGVSEKDKRRMMRVTLYYYKAACEQCKVVPVSTKTTNSKCATCGSF